MRGNAKQLRVRDATQDNATDSLMRIEGDELAIQAACKRIARRTWDLFPLIATI